MDWCDKLNQKAQDWRFAAAVLGVLGALIYSNTLRSPFVFDDDQFIVSNAAIRDLGNPGLLWSLYKTRLIPFFTLALNYRVGGYDVLGYHIVNIGVHVLASLIVYALVRLTLATPRMKQHPAALRRYPVALFAALVFLCHPVQTQAVTYLSQRMASIAALFYLAAVAFYAAARLRAGPRGGCIHYAAALGCAVLAAFSKQNTFTLPFAIVLYEVCFFGGAATGGGKSGGKVAPALAAFFVPFAVAFAVFVVASDVGAGTRMLTTLPRMHYLFTELNVVRTYIRLLFLPFRQTLDYDYPISTSLFEGRTFLSLLFLASWVALAVRLYRNHPFAAFGILWFFLTLSVESSVVPINDVIFEHRMYLPMLGFAAAVPAAAALRMKSTARLMGTSLAVIAALAALTYTRNFVWAHPVTLWSDVVAKAPGTPRGQYNLGRAFTAVRQFERARGHFERAAQIQEERGLGGHAHTSAVYLNLGDVYERLNLRDKASAAFEKAAQIDPVNARALLQLGRIRMDQEDYEGALKALEAALAVPQEKSYYGAALDDMRPLAWVYLGEVYYKQGKGEEGAKAFQEALREEPESPSLLARIGRALSGAGKAEEAKTLLEKSLEMRKAKPIPQVSPYTDVYQDLAGVYHTLGDHEKEKGLYEEAVQADPDNSVVYVNYGTALAQDRELEAAKARFEMAIEIRKAKNILNRPVDAHVFYNLGKVFHELGEIEKEIESYRKAVELNPQYDKAYSALGDIYFDTERYDEAVIEFEKVVALGTGFGTPLFKLGLCYSKLADWKKSLEKFERSLESEKDAAAHPMFYNGLGQAYLELGRSDEAVAALRKAIEMAPDAFVPHYNIALAYAQKQAVDAFFGEVQELRRLNQDGLAEQLLKMVQPAPPSEPSAPPQATP